MITGDHHLIARTIGREIGIVKEDGDIIDGSALSGITEQELRLLVKKTNAFSRVSPEQKLLITQAAMDNGETVIVTGDGVNDAPAIKKADIGVAMGISGTDVAKEVADMVLQDNNYSTIVEAVRQGRGIFSNFVKFLRYQISCNLSGVLIMIPITTDTYTLINRSQAVATITGTAGWEALLRGKPTLVFGYSWYRYAPGAYRVDSVPSLRDAFAKITAGVRHAEADMLGYLRCFDRISFHGYLEEYGRDTSSVKRDQNVATVTEKLLAALIA
jgi:hypothetical protein